MNDYQRGLLGKMDEYAHFVYKITKGFPKSELYGVVSQIRRASVSVVLNYVEGYARKRPLVRLNFLEISFGSLKESKYLLYFSSVEEYLKKDDYIFGLRKAEELCAMLWTEINNLEKATKNKKFINCFLFYCLFVFMNINTEQFNGPLDLLVQMINDEKLDIAEVSLGKIADQFVNYIKNSPDISTEEVADFLAVAAKLLLIKSKTLLPYLIRD